LYRWYGATSSGRTKIIAENATVQTSVSALCICSFDDGILASLLSTHPSTEKRVQRLQKL
jgi:Zn-dependent protease with chaperone function